MSSSLASDQARFACRSINYKAICNSVQGDIRVFECVVGTAIQEGGAIAVGGLKADRIAVAKAVRDLRPIDKIMEIISLTSALNGRMNAKSGNSSPRPAMTIGDIGNVAAICNFNAVDAVEIQKFNARPHMTVAQIRFIKAHNEAAAHYRIVAAGRDCGSREGVAVRLRECHPVAVNQQPIKRRAPVQKDCGS